MKSLVTGVAGFIGSHLAEALVDEGHEVVGIDCFTDCYPRRMKESNIVDLLSKNNFEFLEEDLLTLDLSNLLKEIDYVFHEAAQAGVRTSWGTSFELYTRNNILATQRLLEATKGTNLKKFIYASSSSVYGDAESYPAHEKMVPRPISPYGVSKLAGENLCFLYWKNFGVPTILLRYFTVYGPRQRPDMAFCKFIKAILENEEIQIYGDGEQTRDFTYINDAVQATILAMGTEAEGEIFNIGGGTRTTVNKIIEMLEEMIGDKAFVKYVEPQKGDVRHTAADISKAKRILGYKPEVGIEIGLREEVRWLKDACATRKLWMFEARK